jgi:hypothetical protein
MTEASVETILGGPGDTLLAPETGPLISLKRWGTPLDAIAVSLTFDEQGRLMGGSVQALADNAQPQWERVTDNSKD